MKAMIETVRKNTRIKVWAVVSSVLLTLMIATTVVLNAVPFLYGTINSVLGGERRILVKGDPSEYVYYEADYANKSEALTAANLLNERINEEGIVLLKNEDNALPLASESRVTVFGKNSVNMVLGGSGSNAGSVGGDTVDLYSSLQSAGITYNPAMKTFYEAGLSGAGRAATPGMGAILTGYPIGETPASAYTNVRSSYSGYNTAAIAVISRIGGEGYDLPRTMFWDGSRYTNWSGSQKIPGARSADDHYLQLDQNEADMLKEACDNFTKVIVVINSASPLELGFLDDSTHYAYNAKIKAALWIGNPGKSGLAALGRVLNGSVTPSGKTVDTYARNFSDDPTWNNFGNNRKDGGNRYYTLNMNGTINERNAYFVDYKEGIYVGYRYYETRGYTERQKVLAANPAATEEEQSAWYKSAVVFPFGYGLSYTDFSWTVVDQSPAEGTALSANDTVTVSVNVKNEGSYPGKEVVQLYYTAPYKGAGGIEKAHVVLGDFVKTKELAPKGQEGDSVTVTLTMKVRDMASYDCSDANGFKVEAGAYEIKIMRDAHKVEETICYTVENGIKYDTDSVTGKEIKNLFKDAGDHIDTYLSRSDWKGTWPRLLTADDRSVSQDFINSLTYRLNDTAADPWYSDNKPVQNKNVLHYNRTKVKLYDLIRKDYKDPLWNELLDQLTIAQMETLITRGNYRTMNIDNIAKPLTIDADGPMGFAIFMKDPSVYDTCYYASECVLAATWNEELALEMGVMVGNEGLIGYENGDGRPYSGWYAPAVNIHRSQFSGRNFEYYSEDGLLSGRFAVKVIKGASSKGVYTYVKHFALNDQETNRDTTGLITWANEQSMRELYFLPFEMAVKDGETTAMMSSFNRIGTVWAGGNYALLTQLLREEWGFRGMVITDFNLTVYMDVDQMIRAGGDLNLSPSKGLSSTSTATSITAMRQAVKNILYTVVGSNAMNGMGENVVYRYATPYWVIWLIVGDVGVFALCAAWGAFMIIRTIKKSKENIPTI